MADNNIDNSDYRIHTKKYTEFLENYIEHIKKSDEIKNDYKKKFFQIIVGIMIVLTVL